MQILLNGRWRTVGDGTSVAALIDALSLQPQRVAVERNRQIVPRRRYGQTILGDRDELEIVTLVGGG